MLSLLNMLSFILATFHEIGHPIDHFILLILLIVFKNRYNFHNIFTNKLANLIDDFG